MLSVNAALVSGFVGAYAQRIGDPARQRIWYFPASTGAAPEVTAGSGTVVLSDGILIGPEHLPGAYRITVWISDRPFSRSEIEAAAASGTLPPRRSTLDLQVAP
jgi:hypothetical protein